MAQGRIWVKNRKIYNSGEIYWKTTKPGSETELDDLNSFLTLALENICHVTSYDCLFVKTENRKWGAEFTYDGYQLDCFSYCSIMFYMNLPGMVYYNIQLMDYLTK